VLQLRIVWWLTGLAGCAAVAALAGGFSLSLYGEPDARTASRDAIVRYLATSDLRLAPPAKLDPLIDRLADELRADANFSADRKPSDSQRQLLVQNVEVLQRRWFVTRVNGYHELLPNEQRAYLDEQIDTLLAWAKVDAALVTIGSPAIDFFADIERWIAEEPNAEQQDRMQQAVGDGIARWLATHDLSEQPPAVRRKLAIVIAGGLNDGVDLASVKAEQSPVELPQLRDNSLLLVEAWLSAQAETYAALPADERGGFLDARIDEVARWKVFDLLSIGDASGANARAMSWSQFAAIIDTWIARAEPSQQPQLQALATDVQARILQRMFQSLRGR
jgi:hypothetical protein